MRFRGFNGLFLILLVLLLLFAALPPPVEALALRGERQVHVSTGDELFTMAYAEIIQLEITPAISLLGAFEPEVRHPYNSFWDDGVKFVIDLAMANSIENRTTIFGVRYNLRAKSNTYYVTVSFPWRR